MCNFSTIVLMIFLLYGNKHGFIIFLDYLLFSTATVLILFDKVPEGGRLDLWKGGADVLILGSAI